MTACFTFHTSCAGDAPLPGIMKIGPAVCRGRKRSNGKGTKLIGIAASRCLCSLARTHSIMPLVFLHPLQCSMPCRIALAMSCHRFSNRAIEPNTRYPLQA